jgi:hypothetical protein
LKFLSGSVGSIYRKKILSGPSNSIRLESRRKSA